MERQALEERADQTSRRQEELRNELEQARSELERLASEAATLRDRAASAGRVEDELRAARDEVARLQADCQAARAAAARATREFEDLLDHSSALPDGFYQALAEIEANSAETLIHPREAERLRVRLGELEGQVAEAVTARRAVEDDFARTLRVREQELETLREELGTLHSQMKELAAVEAEERHLRSLLASERVAIDDVAAGLAERPGSGPEVDVALELIDLREFLPQLMDLRGDRPPQPKPETAAPPVDPGIATGPVADREIRHRPESVSAPPVDLDALKAEAERLRAEVLQLISAGRKKDAETRSRRMIELTRTIAGELSPDHSTWITVVGQLQAEQGDWAGASDLRPQERGFPREIR